MKIWWLSLLAKLILASFIPLSADESYYWIWSRFPQLSYYDHPPFVAYLLSLGDLLQHPSFVRWPAVILAHSSLLVWLWALKDDLKSFDSSSWWWLILFNPLTGPGSLVVTPDLPLIFFWGTALGAWLRLRQRPRGHTLLSVAWGAAMGLGFLSKYSIAVLAILIFIDAVLILRWPMSTLLRALSWAVPPGILVSLPVWLWNWQHDWISFGFQLRHGLGATAWDPSWTISYVLGQLAILWPPIVYLATKARVERHILLFAWGPVAFFLFTSLRGSVEANWALPAYPLLLALSSTSSTPHKKLIVRSTLGIWITALLGLFVTLSLPELPYWARRTKLLELKLPTAALEAALTYEPLFAYSYQLASKLAFESRRPIFKLAGMTRRDYFDELPQSRPNLEEPFFLINRSGEPLPLEYQHLKVKIIQRLPDQLELWEIKP